LLHNKLALVLALAAAAERLDTTKQALPLTSSKLKQAISEWLELEKQASEMVCLNLKLCA
jgi:hypothetical protein